MPCRDSNYESSGCAHVRFTSRSMPEVRFEVAHADRTARAVRTSLPRLSPSTSRHDPTELFLQLDDLLTKSRLLEAGRVRVIGGI